MMGDFGAPGAITVSDVRDNWISRKSIRRKYPKGLHTVDVMYSPVFPMLPYYLFYIFFFAPLKN